MIKYAYEIRGTDANQQTWEAYGHVETRRPGSFLLAPELAIRDAFKQVTGGKAIYGAPGVACKGPYRVLFFKIFEMKQ